MLKPLIIQESSIDEDLCQELIEELQEESVSLSKELLVLMINRGLRTVEDIKAYIRPSIDMMHNPFMLKGMRIAVERIEKAILNKEFIVVYGDYDVDGITSTSTLVKMLKACGANVSYYIPDRLNEGYGINKDALEELRAKGASLAISVDTGITAVNEAMVAKEIGLDLIITDHHECQEEIPNALCVINPKQADCRYPFKDLAGVGVTFKLVQALNTVFPQEEDFMMDLFEIVAIGTIADIVPLHGENRNIVYQAFRRFEENNSLARGNKGLRALLAVSGNKDKPLSAGTIGFQVGPRLNAAGRLGDAKRGVQLFLSEDDEEVMSMAETLNVENTRRKTMEEEIFMEADQLVQKENRQKDAIIVVAYKGWHHGVIGIVASRITEKYYRPTILLTVEDGIASGSARSVEGFSIFDALMEVKSYFLKVGGHEMAAGMSLEAEKVDGMRQAINQYAKRVMDSSVLIPKKKADMSLPIEKITTSFIESLDCMEPYGAGNPQPTFKIHGYIHEIKIMGKTGQHLKLNIKEEDSALDVVSFFGADIKPSIFEDMPVELVGHLNVNEWKGFKRPQMFLQGIQYNKDDEKRYRTYKKAIDEILDKQLKAKEWADQYGINCDRQDCIQLYKQLRLLETHGSQNLDMTDIELIIDSHHKDIRHGIKILLILMIFNELGLVTLESDLDGSLKFELIRGKKVELEKSTLYNKLSESI